MALVRSANCFIREGKAMQVNSTSDLRLVLLTLYDNDCSDMWMSGLIIYVNQHIGSGLIPSQVERHPIAVRSVGIHQRISVVVVSYHDGEVVNVVIHDIGNYIAGLQLGSRSPRMLLRRLNHFRESARLDKTSIAAIQIKKIFNPSVCTQATLPPEFFT